MAGEISDVVIAFTARTEEFDRGLAQTRRKLVEFSNGGAIAVKSLGAAFSGLRNSLAAIGVTVGVGTILALAKQSISAASATVDLADALGTSTEAIQRLHFAAEQSGASIETVDSALGKLSQTATAAASGNDELNKLFTKTLGSDLRQNRQLLNDLPKLLELVIKGTDRFGTAAERNSARLKLLGRGTLELGTLAADGGRKLSEAAQRFDELGLLVSDQDLRRLEEVGDKFGEVFAVIRSEFIKTIAELSRTGLLTELADSLIVTIRQTGEIVRALISVLAGAINVARSIVGEEVPVPGVPEAPARRSAGDGASVPGSDESARRIVALTARTRELQGALAALAIPPGFERQLALINSRFDAAFATADKLSDSRARTLAQEVAVQERLLAIETLRASALEESRAALEKTLTQAEIDRLPSGERQFAEQRAAAQEALEKRLREIGEPGLNPAAQEAFQNAQKIFHVTMQGIDDAQARAESFTAFLEGSAAGAIEDFGRQLSNSFFDADFSFKTFLQSFIAGVARMIVEATTLLAIQRALSAAGGAIGGGFGSSLTSIAGAITLGSGGVVTKPTFAMVGESGPEAVIPLSRFGGGVGGGDVTVEIINSGQPLRTTGTFVEQSRQGRRVRVEVQQAVADGFAGNAPMSRVAESTFGLNRRGQRRG